MVVEKVLKKMELKNCEAAICSYINENNLPISSIEPLIELIESLPEKAITSQMSLAKQKDTNDIRNDYALGLFIDFNWMFQADYLEFSELKTEELIKTFPLNFMNRIYVKQTPANQINPHQTEEHLELKRIYLGVDATHSLTEVENKENCEVQKIFQ
ncbi:hypothetical protein WA026_021942 [Henosepilachna vigintioctopunctata]|uniref:Uncharacterized protein n=1 Tax=Henosepilachna vigintioctopunctata TaxID=420089 RepID=A0AAW1VGL8_9CUCU